ncbi:DUF2309 domain-containing protein [Pseudidiomarina insulisalsae]|nr:DUF2309 domain-containing protein [Pseudidiomarina insulisalsae]
MSWSALGKHVCSQVAPVWPLARSIAVNPWWQRRQETIDQVAISEQTLLGTAMLMPADYYRARWQQQIQPEHLARARQLQGSQLSEAELVEALNAAASGATMPSVAQILDSGKKRNTTLPWQTEIVHQLSQFCALWVNYPEQFNGSDSHDALYLAWLDIVRHDRGIELLVGERRVEEQLQQLPRDSEALWQEVAKDLPLNDPHQVEAWLQVVLHDIYGWASVFAQRRWARQLEHSSQVYDELDQLLAIRVAWELICWRLASDNKRQRFIDAWQQLEPRKQLVTEQQQALWVWQRALELSYQDELATQLVSQPMLKGKSKAPELQAVFCIDVRSEPMRRALEAQHESIQTFGFAGFFGLPVDYKISESFIKPQLPGLLAPQYRVTQAKDAEGVAQRTHSWRAASWHRSLESPAGAYGWVEMSGLAKIWKLLERSLWPSPQARIGSEVVRDQTWLIERDGEAATTKELAQLAANALRGMGLTGEFARHVLIVGHSACVTNNPHAASLDCGACGGQSGEVNARVLVQLFNNEDVRERIASVYGITIPAETVFYPALHDTTQQQVSVLGERSLPAELANYLVQANAQAQDEQRQRLPDQPTSSDKALLRRAASWSEVRPEWGLARNASIIFAPREATANYDFAARTFLHSYDAEQDPEGAVLTQLMTAPMVVAHWINMQYYASMVAPVTFGSGNKLLHNVVADGVGVFEGNGGDLRIGLAKQSLHDGKDWYHEPLRLTVVIAAPTDAIDKVIAEQPVVRELVENGWLYLWQWEPAQQQLQERTAKGWSELGARYDLAV